MTRLPLCRCAVLLVLCLTPSSLVMAADAAAVVPLGGRVTNLRFKDIRYLNRTLDDFPDAKAFVLVFADTTCPLAARYWPTLRRLDATYRGQGVQFLAVNVGAEDTVVQMAAQAVEYEVEFPFVKDTDGSCAAAVGAEYSPQVVVLDAQRRLVYRGRIDDQYRPGGGRPAPTRHDLREALDAVLAGKPVAVPSTPVDGCRITRAEPRPPEKPLTFSGHVAPLLRQHCQGCHQPDGSAPFALVTYDQVKGKAKAIAEVVADGSMPPWYGAPGHGPFVNRRGLAPAERDVIVQWVRGGAAPGDPTPAAEVANRDGANPGEWRIGTPDLVLSTGTEELPADGVLPYRYVVLPHLFLGDTWVQDIQILPDNPRVVHHANLVYATAGKKLDASNFITGLVPGGEPTTLDDGVAVRIPAGSVLGLQIHFVTTGKAEKCRIRVGLRYPRAPVKKQLRHVLLVDHRFAIPPHAPAHRVRATHTLDRDAIGVGLFAHMHVRGKAMVFRATPPDGDAETLLVIPNYNFEWQHPYRWEPGKHRFAKGTLLECVAVYDNSAFNPYNPDPTATVRDGPQTFHEMMNGFFFYVAADEDLNLRIDPKTGRRR